MPKFQCGSPTCSTKFKARTQEELMAAINDHVQKEHAIPVPTKSIMTFLAANCVTES